jgi:hypothetical protein
LVCAQLSDPVPRDQLFIATGRSQQIKGHIFGCGLSFSGDELFLDAQALGSTCKKVAEADFRAWPRRAKNMTSTLPHFCAVCKIAGRFAKNPGCLSSALISMKTKPCQPASGQ